jgi:hypothetical protein
LSLPSRARTLFVLGIAAAAVLTRLRSFEATLGDSNVGTYLFVAHQWVRGALPYTTAWEYKPPGIFALYALALHVTNDGSFISASFGAIAVIVTALAVARFVRYGFGEPAATAAIAAFFVVFLSTENDGILNDAEILVNAFVALAYAAVSGPRRIVAGALAGLAGGAALQMKLTALPMLLPLGVFVAVGAGAGIVPLAAFSGAALAPFALEALVYASAQAFGAFADANFAATLRRLTAVRSNARFANLGQWSAEVRILAPVLELVPFAVLRPGRARFALGWAWLGMAAAAIFAAGEFYDRHFVLLVPPVAALGAAGVTALGRAARAPRLVTTLALLATFALHEYYETEQGLIVVPYHRYLRAEHDFRVGDYTLASGALRAAMGDDRSLYVLQASPLLYADMNAPAPTRYVFSGNLLERGMWPMIGFHGPDEVLRVLAGRPHFVVAGNLRDGKLDPAGARLVQAVLRRDYDLIDDAHRVSIYRLKGLDPKRALQSRPSRSKT